MNPTTGRRITYITAGAAGMYCGSCMHDNTLARALSDVGYDTLLVPTYTPIRTDEKEVTVDQVFFGGINVYLQQKIPLFRHIPKFLDRFLDRPGLIRKVTSMAIETDGQLLGGLVVSMLKGKTGYQKKEVRRLVRWLSDDARPDAVVLTNVLIAGFVSELRKHLNVPVIVTLQGDDIFLNSLSDPWRREALELIGKLDSHIDAYIVHSRFYADFMAEFCGLSRDKMHITPLGIDTTDFQQISRSQGDQASVNIGYLARLDEDKGLHNLVSAFIELKKRTGMDHVRLQIAGWLGKDHTEFANRQFQRLDDEGLSDDYQYLGSIDREEKVRMLGDLTVLSVPTDYYEPKGLYVLEALACGVPVVQPAHGVFPEMLEDLGGGRLFSPGNIDQLTDILAELVSQPDVCQQLGAAGRENVLSRRNSQSMALSTKQVIDRAIANHQA